MTLRDYQLDLKMDIYSAWNDGARNVLAVLPTGGGKTVVFSQIVSEHEGASVCIAHRQEIVSQISLTLAHNGIRHKIIGPSDVALLCTKLHLLELGRNYIDPSSKTAVAGVDTLIRLKGYDSWLKNVTLVICDEAHHVLRSNKWGKSIGMFPNARMLGVTATPVRADGNGLGRSSDGVMDWMIEGPTMRELINENWLTTYRIFAPTSDIDLGSVPISASGDYSPPKLSAAVHKSHIVGDVICHYKRICNGRTGVTFAVDVMAAGELAAAYRSAGVPAAVVSANTPDTLRQSIIRRFRNRELLQLTCCDLFGEGFDLPAIEIVTMARPTQSYGLFCQQFGRALRPMKGKQNAIIIDHVGNVHRHGLPDAPRVWSLDRAAKRTNASRSAIPIRTCPGCVSAYEAYLIACPYCGFVRAPMGRSTPDEVDGDLHELSPEALAKLRGEIDAPPTYPHSAAPEVIGYLKKIHREKTETQLKLREVIARWAGAHSQATDMATVKTLQRKFYSTFGIDVGTAMTLNKRNAEQLMERIGV